MKYLFYSTIGMMILTGVCAISQHAREAMIGVICVVSMYLMGLWSRYSEHRGERKVAKRETYPGRARPIKLMAVLVALSALKAKALLVFALVALGIGLILWGGLRLVYAMMTIAPRIQRNDVAWITKTQTPELAARPIRLISATPFEIHEADASAPWAYRKAEGTRLDELEHSADLVEWKAWEPTGAQVGFWRERE